MKFDFTINLGTVIALLIMLATFHSYHMTNVKRFMTLEFQVRQMWGTFKKRFNISDDNPFDIGDQ